MMMMMTLCLYAYMKPPFLSLVMQCNDDVGNLSLFTPLCLCCPSLYLLLLGYLNTPRFGSHHTLKSMHACII